LWPYSRSERGDTSASFFESGAAAIAAKSIIDVEMQTAAWDRFQTQWNAYNAALKQQPEIWKKIQAQHEKLAGSFANLGDKVAPISNTHADLTTAAEDQEKALSHTAELWGGIGAASGRTARNIESGTKGLLKWAGIFAGLGTVLGGLGLDAMMRLGGDVFNQRKSALGLGLTVGQERSFNIIYSQLLGNPGAFLSGINTGETDITSPAYRAMQMLGVNPNAPAGQASAAMMQKIFNLAHTLPKNMLEPYAQAMGLGAFGITGEDMMRYRSMSPAQFAQQQALAAAEARLLNLTNTTTLAWTNFLIKMELAKQQIENVFVKLLTPLAGPLANLTTGFEHLMQVLFVKNGTIAKDIDAFATWIGKLNNKDFETFGTKLEGAITKFQRNILDLGQMMENIAHHPLEPSKWAVPLGSLGGDKAAFNAWYNNPANMKYASWEKDAYKNVLGFAAFRTPQAGLNALAQLDARNALKYGSTVKSIIGAYDPGDPNLGSYIDFMAKKMGVSPTAHIDVGDPAEFLRLLTYQLRDEQGVYHNYHGRLAAAAQASSAAYRAQVQQLQPVRVTAVVEVRDRTSLGVHAQVAAHGATP
jgi:hypothetical protein